MLAIGVALKLAIDAFVKLGDVNYTAILKSLSEYKLTLIALSGVLVLINRTTKSSAKSMLMFSAAVLLFSFAVKQIINIGDMLKGADPKVIAKGVMFVSAMMGLMTLFGRLNKSVIEKSPGKRLGRTLISIGVTITGLIAAVYVMGKMKPLELAKGVLGVTALIIVLTKSLGLIAKNAGKIRFGTLTGIIIGVTSLGIELALLSNIPVKRLITGLTSLGILMGMLSGTMISLSRLMKYSKGSKKSIGSMIALIVETSIMVGALKTLSAQPYESILAASASLSSTLLAYGGTLLIMRKAASQNISVAQDAKMLLGGIGALAVVSGAIFALSTFGKDSKLIIASASAISMGMLAYAGSLAIVKSVASKTPDGSIFDTVLSGIAMTGIVTLSIGLLSRFGGSAENIIASAEAISIGLLAFAGVMVIIGATADLSKAATKAAGYIIGAAATIGTAIGVMAAILVAFAEIIGWCVKNFDSDGSNLKAFGDAMGAIGDAFGSLIANLINKVGEASVRALTNILGELVRFVNALSNLPPHDVDAATASLVALGRMAAHSDGLKDLDLKSLGSAFGEISSAFKSVKDTLAKNLTDEDFKMLTKIMGTLGELGKAAQELPAVGVLQAFTGIKDYQYGIYNIGYLSDTIKEAIVKLRKNSVAPGDVKLVGSIISILGEFGTAAQKLPKAWGLAQLVTGVQLYDDAINAIGNLATKISTSTKEIRKVKVGPDDLQIIKDMIGVYSVVASALAETEVSGGVVGWWEGDWTNGIPDVIDNIGGLASALSDNIGKFKSAGIDAKTKPKIVNSYTIRRS